MMVMAVLHAANTQADQANKTKVLCTTFPIYQITRSMSQGSGNLEIDLMIPAGLGCPHDYIMTPQDMQKIAKADMLVMNGLGLEDFLDAAVKKINPNITVLATSKDIEGIIYEKGHLHERTPNPHLFVSPHMRAKIAANIAASLAQLDPANTEIYLKNADTYTLRMTVWADAFAAAGRAFKNKRIVTQHNVFHYLARDMGLEIVTVVQAHPGQSPSAARMLKVIEQIKKTNACAIFTEPQYSDRIARTLAKETGIIAAVLDPAATGPKDAGLDYDDKIMRANLEVLKACQ